LWEDFFTLLNAKERRIIICLRNGVTKIGDVAEILGYANHSPESKRLAQIRRKAKRFFEIDKPGLIALKNPSRAKMNFKNDHENTLAQNHNSSCAILERNFSRRFCAIASIFQKRGFFSRIGTDTRPLHR
jgi:hypothetical protein